MDSSPHDQNFYRKSSYLMLILSSIMMSKSSHLQGKSICFHIHKTFFYILITPYAHFIYFRVHTRASCKKMFKREKNSFKFDALQNCIFHLMRTHSCDVNIFLGFYMLTRLEGDVETVQLDFLGGPQFF